MLEGSSGSSYHCLYDGAVLGYATIEASKVILVCSRCARKYKLEYGEGELEEIKKRQVGGNVHGR